MTHISSRDLLLLRARLMRFACCRCFGLSNAEREDLVEDAWIRLYHLISNSAERDCPTADSVEVQQKHLLATFTWMRQQAQKQCEKKRRELPLSAFEERRDISEEYEDDSAVTETNQLHAEILTESLLGEELVSNVLTKWQTILNPIEVYLVNGHYLEGKPYAQLCQEYSQIMASPGVVLLPDNARQITKRAIQRIRRHFRL